MTASPTPTSTPVPNVLFVVGNIVLSLEDSSVRSQLAALNPMYPGDVSKILVMADDVVQTANALGKDLVVISNSAAAFNVQTKFRDVSVPVILWEDSLYDDMGMVLASGLQYGTANGQIAITIIDATHPLAGNLSLGNHTVYVSPDTMTWGNPDGVPGTEAIKIATLTSNSTRYVIFGYDTGAVMPGLPNAAPARRVGFMLEGINLQSGLTAEGLLLFNAAVVWTAGW